MSTTDNDSSINQSKVQLVKICPLSIWIIHYSHEFHRWMRKPTRNVNSRFTTERNSKQHNNFGGAPGNESNQGELAIPARNCASKTTISAMRTCQMLHDALLPFLYSTTAFSLRKPATCKFQPHITFNLQKLWGFLETKSVSFLCG